MVSTKNSTVRTKAKGSEALKNSLLHGDVRKIAERLGMPYINVSNVIGGRYFGDKDIVECAERLAAFYKSVYLQDNINQIIESYGPIDKN